MDRKTQGMSAMLVLGLLAAPAGFAQQLEEEGQAEPAPPAAAETEASRSSSETNEWQGRAYDAWIDGKLEASLLINTALNNFKIDTHVEDGHVTLEGVVDSETESNLAEEIARSIDGVASVDNRLRIASEQDTQIAGQDASDPGLREEDDRPALGADDQLSASRAGEAGTERSFSTRFHDLTTTARLKSSFALSDQLSARAIEIDTRDGVVTLEGEVASEEQRDLAERLAEGYDHVTRVENNLRVSGQAASTRPPADDNPA